MICFVTVAGIPARKLIEAHGSFATATCRKCQAKYTGQDILVSFSSYSFFSRLIVKTE